jgi:hypothetical protein
MEPSQKHPSGQPWPARRGLYPWYAFRMWHGMTAPSWFRILVRNRFAISPARLPLALQLSVYSIINSLLGMVQKLIFGQRVAAAVLDKPPLFIIGHWRTGTTYLHEMMSLDERFTAPKTLECFAPGHFLVSGWLLRLLSFFLPSKRPMDDMFVSWDSPQEEEFALLNWGLHSPYETMMFPNHRPVCNEFFNIREVAGEQVEAWKAGLLAFLQAVNFRSRRETGDSSEARRIVSKSPPHTARLHILRQMFPGAQFIHVVREPCEIFASTVWLWRALFETQGFQKPQFGALPNGGPTIEQYVLDTMDVLYRDFFNQVANIPGDQFCEVRREDLIRTPLAEMDRIYRHLNLGKFHSLRPKLEAHLRKLERYKPNEYHISEMQKAEVRRRWNWYIERYNYFQTSSCAIRERSADPPPSDGTLADT